MSVQQSKGLILEMMVMQALLYPQNQARWSGFIRWSWEPQKEVIALYLYLTFTWESAQTAAKPAAKAHIIVLYSASVRELEPLVISAEQNHWDTQFSCCSSQG